MILSIFFFLKYQIIVSRLFLFQFGFTILPGILLKFLNDDVSSRYKWRFSFLVIYQEWYLPEYFIKASKILMQQNLLPQKKDVLIVIWTAKLTVDWKSIAGRFERNQPQISSILSLVIWKPVKPILYFSTNIYIQIRKN